MAIEEAYKGAPYVSPNPLVGCVVLDSQGNLLSTGYHQKYGQAHAEVNAIQGLTEEQLRGAHVIVTLEPCAHQGKTPSCAKMLARLPIAKVTYGLVDPNPLVAGQGAQILRDAGIKAEEFSSADKEKFEFVRAELEKVCEAFLWNFRQKKIFVALKVATSLDGQIALKSGESQWITGPESREYVHYLRSCYDAVLVGKGTVSVDDPSLNVRLKDISKENKVVVLDSRGELLSQFSKLKLAQAHKAENIYWCVGDSHLASCQDVIADLSSQPQLVGVPQSQEGALDLEVLLAELYKRGMRSLMVEGGAQVASQFVAQGLVNRLWLFMAPVVLGAGGGISWTQKMSIAHMKEKKVLGQIQYMRFGQDLCWTGLLKL